MDRLNKKAKEAAFIKQNETINQKEAFSEVSYLISVGISSHKTAKKYRQMQSFAV